MQYLNRRDEFGQPRLSNVDRRRANKWSQDRSFNRVNRFLRRTKTWLNRRLPGFCLLRDYQSQAGNAIIEMGVTLPIILILILGTLDLGRAVYVQNIITNAAREGARYGTSPPIDLVEIESKTLNYVSGVDPANVIITASQPSTDKVRVTITYTFTAITPIVGNLLDPGGTLTLQGISTMTTEGS